MDVVAVVFVAGSKRSNVKKSLRVRNILLDQRVGDVSSVCYFFLYGQWT